ncbi:hypothetical protein AJ80_05560 [Polytolypa hystricis UAMH7299]|uniref:gamma-glutamylcyclotransferase n=1 Tax=Polytolypa hystricis (strain UAMH7299) TaxID=1447883 RepID=A0A2B7Y1Q2_POLH7|nr:hypothetical protein AJ80_05560 [Polytolypa hystricis UAMH7299]
MQLLPDQRLGDEDGENNIWYLGYGSNMNSETFRSHRGIAPLKEMPVRVPGWVLTFDIYGVPYQEPAFSSITPVTPAGTLAEYAPGNAPPPVHGTAYLLTKEDYISVIGSEGGGIAYDEVEVLAEPVSPDLGGTVTEARNGGVVSNRTDSALFKVMTLTRAYGPTVPRSPSKRYMELILDGAQEAHLPRAYRSYLCTIPTYQAPKTVWRMIGAALFLTVWIPIMTAVEKITTATANSDGKGNCPAWVKALVRLILIAMWFHHDFVHSRFWGRGDGLDEDGREIEEDLEKMTGAIYLD